jgi:hypothetical protein
MAAAAREAQLAAAERKRPLPECALPDDADVVCRTGLNIKGVYVMATVIAQPDGDNRCDFTIVIAEVGTAKEHRVMVCSPGPFDTSRHPDCPRR